MDTNRRQTRLSEGKITVVSELLRENALTRPKAAAIAAPGRPPVRYEDLASQIGFLVQALQEIGVGRGDAVAIVGPNCPEIIAAALAAIACARAAPLNPACRTAEFHSNLKGMNARALVTLAGGDSPAMFAARARGIPILKLWPAMQPEARAFELAIEGKGSPRRRESVQPDDVALVLQTSGTTGKPKFVPLKHTNLYASDLNARAILGLTANDRYLNLMPLFHGHGFRRTLISLLSGGTVFCPLAFDPAQFLAWWEAFQPTWYSAVPTVHQAILREVSGNREIVERYPPRFLSSSSAPLPKRIAAELEDTFRAPVIEFYGCAEVTPVTCTPLPPRTRKIGSVGVVAGQSQQEVAIMDESGRLLPPGQAGEVVVRGPGVISGYLNDQKATQEAFREGWFRMGDVGYFDPDGHLFLVGRIKEIISRGGEKIAPAEIDEVLASHPSVWQAATFGTPHPTLGEEVVAAVVPRPNCSVTEAGLREFTSARLAPFKVPQRVFFVEEIPKSSTGKLQRRGLAEKLGSVLADQALRRPRGPAAEPRSPLEKELADLWREVLGVEQVGIHDDFFELGGDSLSAMQVTGRLAAVMPREALLDHLLEAPTVAALAKVIGGRRA